MKRTIDETKKKNVMKRIITELEEKVYRCRHQDFEALTTVETAKKLGISEAGVRRSLRNLIKKCPQLFPLLTKQQAFIQKCICERGLTHEEIAALLEVSENALKAQIIRLKKKGIYLEKPRKTVQYGEHMDAQVKNTF